MKCSSHIHLTWHSVLHNVFRRKKRKKKKSARAAEKSMTYWFPSTAGHSLNRILCLWNINAFEQWRPQPFVRIEVPTLCRRRIQNHIASRCWLWWAHSPLRIWAKKKKKVNSQSACCSVSPGDVIQTTWNPPMRVDSDSSHWNQFQCDKWGASKTSQLRELQKNI